MPLEVRILEAANWDPLRAQDIEERLTQHWWDWWSMIMPIKSETEKAIADEQRHKAELEALQSRRF